ncbi:hypothetical protein J7J18_02550 [bacterium]|nr:hypothetical protein [bacterium]
MTEFQRKVVIVGQDGEIDTDILSTEKTETKEVITDTDPGSVDFVKPSPGKRISTRSVAVTVKSNSGEVTIKFKNSGKLLCKLYATRSDRFVHFGINQTGDVDEPVIIEWDGVGTGTKIFALLTYKEV